MIYSGELTPEDASTVPDAAQSSCHAIVTVGRHGGLDDLQGLTKSGDFEQIETGAEQQVGELDRLLLDLARRLGDRESRDGGGGGHDVAGVALRGALTKGKGCFVAYGVVEED